MSKSKKHGLDQLPELQKADVLESAKMADATCTLLRQSFGIVTLFNGFSDNPMSESELKNFATQFDLIHKVLQATVRALSEYACKNFTEDGSALPRS